MNDTYFISLYLVWKISILFKFLVLLMLIQFLIYLFFKVFMYTMFYFNQLTLNLSVLILNISFCYFAIDDICTLLMLSKAQI